MALSPAYKRRVKDAFNEAAARHPYPDRPFVIMNGKPISPNSIARDVENETRDGRAYFEILEFFTKGKELDKAGLNRFAESVIRTPKP